MEAHEKSCGAIVIKEVDKQKYVLVVRQTAGHWGFPKGHVEGIETEKETAFREVQEETGIEIQFIEGFREATHYSPKPGVFKDVIYFIAEPTGGSLKAQADEIQEIRWVRLLDAIALLTYDNDAIILRQAVKYLKQNDEENF